MQPDVVCAHMTRPCMWFGPEEFRTVSANIFGAASMQTCRHFDCTIISGLSPTDGSLFHSCTHLVLVRSESQLVCCLPQDLRSRTGDWFPVKEPATHKSYDMIGVPVIQSGEVGRFRNRQSFVAARLWPAFVETSQPRCENSMAMHRFAHGDLSVRNFRIQSSVHAAA
jgi:hypothetical protein